MQFIPLSSVVFVAMASPPQLVERSPLDFRHLAGTKDKPYIVETMGSGLALFDYDLDSDLDVYFVSGSTLERLARGEPGETNRLFRNDGDFQFTDVTEISGVGDPGFGQGVAVADVDNDGDEDVYVTNYGLNVLYRNHGDGTFSPWTTGVEDERWGTSAAFGDIDNDGYVDLYVCNYLEFDRELLDRLIPRQFCEWKGLKVQCGPRGFGYDSGALFHNRGDGTFEDWTEKAGVANRETYPLGVVFSDLDRDGDQDLYVATDTTLNLLFENRGDGTFADRSLLSGTGLSGNGKEQAGMGVDAGDVNGDGYFDLFVTNFSDDYNTLYLNQGGLRFVDASDVANLVVSSLPYLGWSTRLADLDADGDLDLFVVNGHVYPQVDGANVGESFRQPMAVFLNRGDGTFEDASRSLGTALAKPRSSRGAALGDLDSDLRQDIVVNVMDDAPVLIRNEIPGAEGAVVLRLVARSGNRDGLGALVRARIGGRWAAHEVRGDRGYLSHSDPRVYLGLGTSSRVDEVRIEWPGGGEETLEGLAPGSYVVLEGEGIVHREGK
ncbi:MAG TPA: CRTAC1 family protein [Vicinamibacteria bacterium]|nr:CRTAC1 family protein [Vicinamibacteria bacterium]